MAQFFRRRWPGVSYGRGEDWHYVGEAGEPAFLNSWANSAVSGTPKLAFRIRESGVVDLQGVAVSAGSATTVFSLPAGYAPSVKAPGFVGMSAAGDPYQVSVTADGDVRISPLPANGVEVELSGQFFLTPPDLVP